MKAMLVGGGVLDVATMHPLGALAALLVALILVRRVGRSWAARRRPRAKR